MNQPIKIYLNYFIHHLTKDVYKCIRVDDQVTGYIKYKKVDYRTERKNKDGYYLSYHYPFESYLKTKTKDTHFFKPFNHYLPSFKIQELKEISQSQTLLDRLQEDNIQMCVIRKIFAIFSKKIPRFQISLMGLDASLQCRLETPTSDIDLTISDAHLYQQLHKFISQDQNFKLFSSGIVDRRGAYSSFITTPELIAFENRKISFIFENIKISILFSGAITLRESLISTGSLVFIKTKPEIDKSVGEPSLIKLKNIEIIHGPELDKKREIYYLSVLPVRTSFLLKKDDTLFITGIIYIGEKTYNIYISQLTWDYCKIFNTHNIALNTYLQLQDEDKSVVAHFFENLKL
ncbi:MAG: hypothetical protein AAB491_02100 [Patescibacteria group bacterium]